MNDFLPSICLSPTWLIPTTIPFMFLAKFISDQHVAKFKKHFSILLFYLKPLSHRCFYLSSCNINFIWLPWCCLPIILFPSFCLLLSFLCWLLCLLPTSKCWNASDFNSRSFFLSILHCLIRPSHPLIRFYRPCVNQVIAFSFSAFIWAQDLYFQFLCDRSTWILALTSKLQVKPLLISTSINNHMNYMSLNAQNIWITGHFHYV